MKLETIQTSSDVAWVLSTREGPVTIKIPLQIDDAET